MPDRRTAHAKSKVDARGLPSLTHHLMITASIRHDHTVGLVTLSVVGSDGSPPRLLSRFRSSVGWLHLAGLPSSTSVPLLAQCIADSLRDADRSEGRPAAPAPPEGATGAAVRGYVDEPLPGM